MILAEGDIPWIIVAMIFIAFLRWVFEKIKGPQPEEEFEPEEAFEEAVEAERERPGTREAAGPPPLPKQKSEPGDELRKMLEALTGQEAMDRAPEPAPAPPPAAPPPKAKTEKPRLTAVEMRALKDAQKREAEKRRIAALLPPPSTLNGMLRDPQSIRRAIVLKEILDSPKSLRDDW